MAYGEYERGRGQGPPNGMVGIGRSAASRMIAEEELMRLLLTGLTLKEAASHVRASYHLVRKMAKDPCFLLRLREHSGEIASRMVDELANSQVDFAKKLEEASEAALEEMIAMMNQLEQPSLLKKKICEDLLDRDPRSSRTHRIDTQGTLKHEFINPAVLIHAAATAKELEEFKGQGRAVGQLEDGNTDTSNGHTQDSGVGQGG